MFESGLEGARTFFRSIMIKLLIELTYVITVIAAYISRSNAVTVNEMSDFISCEKRRYIYLPEL